MTLANLLCRAGLDPDSALVHHRDTARSVAEVRAGADSLASALRAGGVLPGAPVAVMLPNGPSVVEALFGVWQAGAVYVPINPRSAAPEVDRLVLEVDPAAVVTVDGVDERPGTRRYDADTALVQFTSGTTGRPKAVLLRHSGVLRLLDGVIAKLRPPGTASRAAPMPNLVPVSLSLWAGIYNVLFALRVGAPVVLMDEFEPLEFAALVRRFEIRSTVLPPAAMTALADDERVTDLAPLRFVRSITAPLSPVQARRFRQRFDVPVLNGYGQTEIGGEIIGWSVDDLREHGDAKLGSVGRPHEGVEVRAGTGGELQVRTPALAAGYADGADLSDRLTTDGWFRTGDVGRVDAEGFVWIDGRLSDVVNRGGLKVFPAEVEEVLRLAPGVADAAVVGIPDERLGEVPWAFLVAAVDGPPPSVAELEALCREHLAPYKMPVRFEAVDALPRNEVGKVQKAALVTRVRRP